MRHSLLLAVSSLACAAPVLACIQTMKVRPPRDAAQLPASLFKLHVDIRPDPLVIELPHLGVTQPLPAASGPSDTLGDFKALIHAWESAPAAARSVEERIDYSAALLFAGRATDAIAVLLRLEREHPGQYATAANLGTAYELAGNLEEAKLWIAKGMERNQHSHEGTEWLHLAILETKQRLKVDADWLAGHSVLDGAAAGRSRAEIAHALEYQLNERLYFIRSNDAVMCDLMYQAALVSDDSAKRTYFLKQVPRFGSIRDAHLRRLEEKVRL